MKNKEFNWPYANEIGQEETITSDVLVLGGGLSGCFAAIAAARRGLSVTLVEKGATEKSGSAGTGFDHWESACTNPCSEVTPEEIATLTSGSRTGTATVSPIILSAGRVTTVSWIWSLSVERSAIRRASLRARSSGMRRPASCLPMITRINLRSVSGEPRLSGSGKGDEAAWYPCL